MANPFETFIQLELPKRPYLSEDVPQESVILRRGAGPRQLSGLLLSEGQTLIMREGKLVGATAEELGGTAEGITHAQTEPSDTWILDHDKDNRNVVVTVLDTDYHAVLYDSMLVESNRITIKFFAPQSGFANVVFV